MWEILSVIILVLDIAVVADIVGGNGDAGGKLFWVGMVLLLPIVGLALYYAMGRRRVGA